MPSLSSFCAVEKPLKVFFDDEGADPARACRRIGLGIDHQHIGIGAVGDPHLVAVENIALAALFGVKLHRNDVGTGPRLGHGQRADMLAGNEFRQIFLTLSGRAVAGDLVDAEIGMRTVAEADGGGSAADFFHRDAMGNIAHAGAAIVFRRGDAKHAKLTQFTPQMHGKLIVAVGFSGQRRNAAFRKTAHRIAKGFDLLAKTEIHAPNFGPMQTYSSSTSSARRPSSAGWLMLKAECPVAVK